MSDMVANLSADFLFPKLHGMWARSLVGERLQRLIHGGREETVARALAPMGIEAGNRAEVQKKLVCAHIAELGEVRRLTDARTARFYGAFLDRYFFENLKTVLHYHYFPEREVSIDFLLIDSPELPRFDAEALLAARNTHQLFSRLPEHPCREALLPLLVELEDTRDILAAECRLDRMFYAELQSAAARLPWGTRTPGQTLVCTEIDITNLVMVLRNIAMYRLPAEAMEKLCLGGGLLLPAATLQVLCASRGVPAVVAALPRPYRKLLEPLAEAELYLSENALWNHLHRLAYGLFTDYNRPAASLVAFAFLKRFEMLNVGRVFEGVHFGLPAADIQEMMIGAGHV